jgi:hypothetical protein
MPLTDFTADRCPDFSPDSQFGACTYFDPAPDARECGFCKKQDTYYRCLAHNGQIPLSHSSVQDFLTCHHLYYLKALRGIQTKDAAKSSPLKCGTLWDAVLQNHLGKPQDIKTIITKYEIGDRDVAKVRALYRAYKMLEIQIESGYELQAKIDLKLGFDKVWGDGYPVEVMVTGFYDRKYEKSFVENKLSGRPDNYSDPWFIESQIATYFLADPSLEYVVMEIARTPDLKSTGKFKDESPDEYSERCYQDILSRPSHYFMGYNQETHRYGRKFHREEFNLQEVKDRFIHIFREYWEARQFSGWFKNSRSCSNILPGIACDLLGVCRYNTMSEDTYQIRKRVLTF